MKKINPKAKFYIVPGWGEKITSINYQKLVNFLKDKYHVVPIKYASNKTALLSENIIQAENQIAGLSSNDIILGFSHGALITYKLATKIKFKKAYICSISPILEKDLSSYPPKDVLENFNNVQVNELNKLKYGKSISPAHLFYGSKESMEVIKRTKTLSRKFKYPVTIVDNCKHILSANYIGAIKKILQYQQ
jgi:hypothetical protein